ncbi:MAG: hypothetical protein AAF637_27140, partial [Pseudomonadota bacterium]
ILTVDWIAFPAIFALLAGPLGLASTYVPFIVARNWASVIFSSFYIVPYGLFAFGLVSPVILTFVSLLILLVLLRFAYQIARTVLVVSPALAIPIVMFEIILSLVIEAGLMRFA